MVTNLFLANVTYNRLMSISNMFISSLGIDKTLVTIFTLERFVVFMVSLDVKLHALLGLKLFFANVTFGIFGCV